MRAFLGLGSNIGERLQNLQAAVNLLDLRVGSVVRIASVYETAPVYVEAQPPFLNTVVELDTNLTPEDLLRAVKEVETEIGRTPRERFGPREIDIDLLITEDGTEVNSDRLSLPHPNLTERRFVLEPLAELCPDFAVGSRRIAEWLAQPNVQAQQVERTGESLLFVHRD